VTGRRPLLVTSAFYDEAHTRVLRVTAHDEVEPDRLGPQQRLTRDRLVALLDQGRPVQTLTKSLDGRWVTGKAVQLRTIGAARYIRVSDLPIPSDDLEIDLIDDVIFEA